MTPFPPRLRMFTSPNGSGKSATLPAIAKEKHYPCFSS
jgi:predicted ATPase